MTDETPESKEKDYLDSYKHWRGSPNDPNFSLEFPYLLPDNENLGAPPVFRPRINMENQILVTRAYDVMFHRLLTHRILFKKSITGALITGQPGIGAFPSSDPVRQTHHRTHAAGKTTFLNFMFARLVSAQQVLLIYNVIGIHLFYRGGVYRRPATSRFKHLPRHKTGEYWPIWALIDMDGLTGEPPLSTGEKGVWPIQAASPDPAQYKKWVKYFRAAVIGMPRWSEEELLKGYVLSLFLVPAADAGRLV